MGDDPGDLLRRMTGWEMPASPQPTIWRPSRGVEVATLSLAVRLEPHGHLACRSTRRRPAALGPTSASDGSVWFERCAASNLWTFPLPARRSGVWTGADAAWPVQARSCVVLAVAGVSGQGFWP